MTVYRPRNRLTIEANYARSPEEALQHVTDEAARVIGLCRLLSCEISETYGVGNSWKIEATFEQEGATSADH